MYVCNCAGVTYSAIQRRLEQGVLGLKALRAELGVCQGCGKCAREVCALLKTVARLRVASPHAGEAERSGGPRAR